MWVVVAVIMFAFFGFIIRDLWASDRENYKRFLVRRAGGLAALLVVVWLFTMIGGRTESDAHRWVPLYFGADSFGARLDSLSIEFLDSPSGQTLRMYDDNYGLPVAIDCSRLRMAVDWIYGESVDSIRNAMNNSDQWPPINFTQDYWKRAYRYVCDGTSPDRWYRLYRDTIRVPSLDMHLDLESITGPLALEIDLEGGGTIGADQVFSVWVRTETGDEGAFHVSFEQIACNRRAFRTARRIRYGTDSNVVSDDAMSATVWRSWVPGSVREANYEYVCELAEFLVEDSQQAPDR